MESPSAPAFACQGNDREAATPVALDRRTQVIVAFLLRAICSSTAICGDEDFRLIAFHRVAYRVPPKERWLVVIVRTRRPEQ